MRNSSPSVPPVFSPSSIPLPSQTDLINSPVGSILIPYMTGEKQLGHCRQFSNAELDTHIQLPAHTDQSPSSKYLSNTCRQVKLRSYYKKQGSQIHALTKFPDFPWLFKANFPWLSLTSGQIFIHKWRRLKLMQASPPALRATLYLFFLWQEMTGSQVGHGRK